MKILVVGCGSIGQRYARLTAARAECAVVDVDPARANACADEANVRAWTDLASALAWCPDGVVVATPPASHLAVAGQAIAAGASVLVEKPVSSTVDGVADLCDQAQSRGRQVYGVCNMRFHPGVATLRNRLSDVGRPLFARAWFGSFLPDMRPGVDHRKLECAQAGYGGVILDNVHEFDYLTWLFGPVVEVRAAAERIGDLGIESTDTAWIWVRHASGVHSEIHLDYLQRRKRRGCEVVGTNGTLVWGSEGKRPERCVVRLYRAGSEDTHTVFATDAVDADQPFAEMMDGFLDGIGGSHVSLASGLDGAHVLRAALAACEAAETGRSVVLATAVDGPMPGPSRWASG